MPDLQNEGKQSFTELGGGSWISKWNGYYLNLTVFLEWQLLKMRRILKNVNYVYKNFKINNLIMKIKKLLIIRSYS